MSDKRLIENEAQRRAGIIITEIVIKKIIIEIKDIK